MKFSATAAILMLVVAAILIIAGIGGHYGKAWDAITKAPGRTPASARLGG